MNDVTKRDEAVELLQQLGLKEYEAKSFVALTRVSQATAKEISELSEVPRTRVYDAVRVLETKGLVEIQHANPQRFRAVSIDEAVETLRDEYESRVETLRETLRGIEPATDAGDAEVTHEVWALSGTAAVANRTGQLIDGASEEVVLVVGHEVVLTDDLVERLSATVDRGVTVVVGTVAEPVCERVQTALPRAEVFVSGLEWLRASDLPGDETEISRILLVDGETILVSTVREVTAGGHAEEQAVFGRGFENGLVTIVRRLMATGLLSEDDPGTG